MRCENREIRIVGCVYDANIKRLTKQEFTCYCTNNRLGKTLSVCNGALQFTIPFDELSKYFIGAYKNADM